MAENKLLIPIERIEQSILLIRGHRIMLDRDLAILYGVSPKVLNQAAKRHRDRFPEDFMFQLTMEETKAWWSEVVETRLRSQSVTLKRRGQHIKYRPYAFTEHGILMLSSVLNSGRAIQVNIEIMRAFVPGHNRKRSDRGEQILIFEDLTLEPALMFLANLHILTLVGGGKGVERMRHENS